MPTQVYKGWNANILYNTTVIGVAESSSVEIATGLEPYYEIGSRTPATLAAGNQEVTGSLSKAWINTAYLNLVTGTGALTSFTLVFKASTATGAPWVYCYNCKFESGSLDIPQDGVLMEDYDFRALSVAVVVAG